MYPTNTAAPPRQCSQFTAAPPALQRSSRRLLAADRRSWHPVLGFGELGLFPCELQHEQPIINGIADRRDLRATELRDDVRHGVTVMHDEDVSLRGTHFAHDAI